MNYDNGCFHCTKDQRLQALMLEIAELRTSTLYLFREQTYRGRCLLSFKGHKGELFDLTGEELTLYMHDLAQAAHAVQAACNPDKINYGAYSDKLPHLHFHIVPKYKDAESWGNMFDMMPENKVWLDDEEYARLLASIKANL